MTKRADGARVWSVVLSELAQVPVVVAWEAPAWRVPVDRWPHPGSVERPGASTLAVPDRPPVGRCGVAVFPVGFGCGCGVGVAAGPPPTFP